MKTQNATEVALLAEGVDRNTTAVEFLSGVWQVALLAEGVDRNFELADLHVRLDRRPPRGGRG